MVNSDKQKLFEMQAEVIQAAGHPIRLAIIDFLKDGEQCVCDIAEAVGAKRSNVSRHLALMHKAGLVNCRKDGLKVMYTLRATCMVPFLDCVNTMLRENIESCACLLDKIE